MTPPNPMTREELLELAALDAFGLLDEYEAALFTRSFHHASAAVQEEIRQFQSEIAGDPQLLPDVEPGPELRKRVLERVSQAIEAESASLEPLALIGRGRRNPRETAVRVGAGLAGQFWRAATFVLAGALIVALYFGIQIYDRNDTMFDFVVDEATLQTIENELDLNVEKFISNPDCVCHILSPTATAGIQGGAMVFINSATGEGFLVAFGLPADVATFTLTAATAAGDQFLSQTLKQSGAVAAVMLDKTITADVVGSLNWSISAVDGSTLLST